MKPRIALSALLGVAAISAVLLASPVAHAQSAAAPAKAASWSMPTGIFGAPTGGLGTQPERPAPFVPASPAEASSLQRFFRSKLRRTLDLQDVPPSDFRVLLRPMSVPMDIDLIDSGEGMLQLVAVLVAASMANREGGPRILAVEEPESHLHPDAQRALAEHLCSLAASPSPPTLVLETHSHALLLAVQLQIAKGLIPSERVGAYWMHQDDEGRSSAAPVTFDSLGRPRGSFPPDVFADHRALARELARAQLLRAEA